MTKKFAEQKSTKTLCKIVDKFQILCDASYILGDKLPLFVEDDSMKRSTLSLYYLVHEGMEEAVKQLEDILSDLTNISSSSNEEIADYVESLTDWADPCDDEENGNGEEESGDK